MNLMGFNQMSVANVGFNMEGGIVGNLNGKFQQIKEKPKEMSSQTIVSSPRQVDLSAPTETETGEILVITKNSNAKKRRKLRARNKAAMLRNTAPILVEEQSQPAPLFSSYTNVNSCLVDAYGKQRAKTKQAKRKKNKGNKGPPPKNTRIAVDSIFAEDLWLPPVDRFQENNVLIYVKVEIVAENNTGLLSKAQSNQILDILMDKLCSLNNYHDSHAPVFQDNPKYVGGTLHLWCGNQPSFNWLKDAVEEMTLPCGVRLSVNILEKIPRKVRLLIIIPYTHAISEIFIHLKAQNRWADVEHWIFHDSYQQQGETIVTVSIPEYLIQTLIEREYQFSYLLQLAYIRFERNFTHIPVELKNDGGYPVRDLLRQILPVSPKSPEIIVLEDSE